MNPQFDKVLDELRGTWRYRWLPDREFPTYGALREAVSRRYTRIRDGETPSPDLLVAAGESEAMAVAPALTMAVSFVVVLFLFAAVASRASLTGLVPMDRPRDVLHDRAEQIHIIVRPHAHRGGGRLGPTRI